VNPPYSELDAWLKKTVREFDRDDPHSPELILMLLPGNTATQWFQQYAAQARYITLIEGRLEFHGANGSAPFASLLACFGDPTDAVLTAFNRLGTVYTDAEIDRAVDETRQSRLEELTSPDGGTTTPAVASQTHPDAAGPNARDLAATSPATTGLALDEMGPGATLYLALDTTTMQSLEVPAEMTVTVLAGAPAATADSQTPDAYDTVLTIHEPSETYVCLYQDPHAVTDIRASVAPDGYGWDDIYLSTIHRHRDPAGWSVMDYHGGLWVTA
jgi:hypothetical protein